MKGVSPMEDQRIYLLAESTVCEISGRGEGDPEGRFYPDTPGARL